MDCTSVRVALSLAVLKIFEAHQLDVTGAILHVYLDKSAYMRQPKGFEEHTKEHMVCMLHKSIDGPQQTLQKLSRKSRFQNTQPIKLYAYNDKS